MCSIILVEYTTGEGKTISIQEIIIKIALATFIGGIVGFQREVKKNSAGFRTHILVSLGACLAMMTNQYLYYQFPEAGIDVARMGSYVISGIGFLGAGSIIKDGFRVRGLTTAAGLWVVACLGLAVGAGFYVAALIASGVVVFVLVLLKLIEKKFIRKRNSVEIELRIKNSPGQLAKVLTVIGASGVVIKEVNMQNSDDKWVDVTITTTITNKLTVEQLEEALRNQKNVGVESVSIVN